MLAAPKQTRFVMPIADDVRLVSVETARAVLGITAEEVFERAEDQASVFYLPAFDVSLKGVNGRPGKFHRELRIWAAALRQSRLDATSRCLETIIADCLLTNTVGVANLAYHLNNSQLERAWCVSNDLLLDLIEHERVTPGSGIVGVRVGRNWRVNRASAAEFLRRRAQ